MRRATFTNAYRNRSLAYLQSLMAWILGAPRVDFDGEESLEGQREFLLEMMKANPEAFQSEMDWHYMIYCYPIRY